MHDHTGSNTGLADTDDRLEIRCRSCGYGAVVAQFPERCPMCGGVLWTELDDGGDER